MYAKSHGYLNTLILTALNSPWIRTTISSSYDAGKIFLDYDATRVRRDA